MKIVGLAGWSGAGKTTLLAALIPELIRRGLTVSTMKQTHHNFDVDQPGKDSYRHRAAGAKEVLIASDKRWALMHELRDAPEPTPTELVRHMGEVDLLLIEGFKKHAHDKLEVYRQATGKPLIANEDPHIVAILADCPVPPTRLPVIDLNDIGAIADFITRHCGFQRS